MIKPLNDYVILTIEKEKDRKTDGGVYLPEEIKSDVPNKGTVIDGGVSGLEPGTLVYFKMWAGDDIIYQDKTYKLVHYKDLIAKEGGEV